MSMAISLQLQHEHKLNIWWHVHYNGLLSYRCNMLVSHMARLSPPPHYEIIAHIITQYIIGRCNRPPPPYGRTSRVWYSLLVMKSGCAVGRGFTPRAGAIVRRVFHPTRKLVRFSLLKCPSIPNSKNSEIRSPRGEV